MFGKVLLGVHRKTVNRAVLGDLGLRPLKLNMKQNYLRYYDHIAQNNSNLLKRMLDESQKMNSTWLTDIISLITESKFEIDKLSMKNHSGK